MSNQSLSRDQIRHIKWGRYPVVADVMNALVDGSRLQWVPEGMKWRQDNNQSVVRRPPRSLRPADWVLCDSLDAVPAFGIVEVYDEVFDSGMNAGRLRVKKATASASYFAGCEDYGLVANGKGWVRMITPYAPVRVNAFYGQAPGFMKGCAISGTSVMQGNGNGQLLSLGQADAQGRVAVISSLGTLILKGQTTVSHPKGSTHTVNVLRRGNNPKGLETFTAGDTVEAYNSFATMAAAKNVAVAAVDDGWELIAGEC